MNKSFTLIEILVVIVVIGVLSAFILVGMGSISDKANIAKSQAFANSLRNSLLISLVSEWKLDGNANDSWGTNNGTLVGPIGLPQFTSMGCVSEQCLDFDGSEDYIDYGDILRPSRTINRSFSFWIKPDSLSDKAIFCTGDLWYSSYGFSQFRITSPTVLSVSYEFTTSPWRYDFSCNTDQNKWNYYVLSINVSDVVNVVVKLYKNGSYIAQTTQTKGTGVQSNYKFTIGSMVEGNGHPRLRFFDGLMDEFVVYDEEVPISQIQQNYFVGINKLFKNNGIVLNEFNQRIGELKNNLAKD